MLTARGEHAGADVADAGHLEHPLDGAVLAPRAVQQREDDVDLAQRLRRLRRLVHDQVGGVPASRGQGDRRAGRRRRSGSSSGPLIRSRSGSPDSSTQRPSVAMPIGTTSYAVAVDRLQHAAGRHAARWRARWSGRRRRRRRGACGTAGGGLVHRADPTGLGSSPMTEDPRRPPLESPATARPSRAGRPPHEPDQPLNAPITMASTYVAGGDLEYGRYGNPTWAAFEEALGALEGGRCLAFSSGLAAVSTRARPRRPRTPWSSRRGTPTTAPCCSSADLEARGRLPPALVDITDTAAVVAACEDAALVWFESPTNPALEVADIETIARGRARGRRLRRGRQHLRHSPAAEAAGARRRHRRALGDEVPRRPQRRPDGRASSTDDDELYAVLKGRRDLLGAIPGHPRGLAGAARPAHPAPAGRAGPGQRRRSSSRRLRRAPGGRRGPLPGLRRRSSRSCWRRARWPPTC